jgi:hypothetical protein
MLGSLAAKKTVRPGDSNSITERTSDLVNDSQVSTFSTVKYVKILQAYPKTSHSLFSVSGVFLIMLIILITKASLVLELPI